jgi:hypothetical protein
MVHLKRECGQEKIWKSTRGESLESLESLESCLRVSTSRIRQMLRSGNNFHINAIPSFKAKL